MAAFDSLAQRPKNPAEVTIFRDTLADDDALIARLAPFQGVLAMRERTPLTENRIARLPALELIVTSGMRNDSIAVEAAKARGIVVCGTRSPGHATAELALGLILALARGIPREAWSVRAGGWQVGLGRDLRGATLGLIGLGRLGAQLAGFAQALGMRCAAWSANLTDARAAEVGVSRAPTLSALLAEADVVSIHQRLSERTRGLLGAAELAEMKPDALLVNTSRAPIVDTAAVLAALRAGTLGGAALDVHDAEPLGPDALARDTALIDSGKLIATPHIGYVTRETYAIFYAEMLEAAHAWLDGAPVRTL